jgi:predicted permease
MIISSLIFFDASFHKIVYFGKMFSYSFSIIRKQKRNTSAYKTKIVLISCFIAFQLLFLSLFMLSKWTVLEKRFDSVMLMEKAGYATFKVKDAY